MSKQKKKNEIQTIDLYKKYKEKISSPIILSNMNFKGGASKTASTALQSYELSNHDFKVLVIDNDPQANLTEFLLQEKEFSYDISNLILDNEVTEKCILSIKENLDIIPSTLNYIYLDELNRSNKAVYNILKKKIDEVKNEYDFIFIDVPPSININLKLAIHACTHINLVVQTKMPSFYGSKKLISWLESYLDEQDIDVNLIGIIQTLTEPKKNKHEEVRKVISDYYKELTYKNYVAYSDRMDYLNNYGITDTENDYWSRVMLSNFNKLNDEMLNKITSM